MANIQSKEVNLTKRIQSGQGPKDWRFCPVVLTSRGQVRPDLVVVNGKEERHPEGVYYIEWRENRKRIRRPAGKDATDANNQRLAKEAELSAINAGVAVIPERDHSRVLLSTAIAEYLDEVKLSKKPKTLSAYTTALDYFAESCHKAHLQEVERTDLLKFAAFLRDERDQSPRSVYNKFENAMTFLKSQGILKPNKNGVLTTAGLSKRDWPKFTEEEPEIYEKEDLEKFFNACTEEERVWFEFFLMSGEREQEVMHTYFSDLNLRHAVVRMTHKADRNWTPKAYKERTIPIPEKLVQSLKRWKAKADKKCNLLFPTSGCKPKLDFLDCCKAIAERAGLNPDDFWLHKFRATFATTHLWHGTDLRTVQDWMGHVDLESTMRYLKPQRGEKVREKVNGAWE
jgi:site-specific recombinase XerD